ncbi:MAG: hypothetical protein CMQ23_00810 [Gammaproteobacteria bacterium]|nr:hypothetical protein [Gammaproteobacteria bacterium]
MRFFLLLAMAFLASCGQKGALYVPASTPDTNEVQASAEEEQP